MSYCKIEYYENGTIKSVETRGIFASFKGSIITTEDEK